MSDRSSEGSRPAHTPSIGVIGLGATGTHVVRTLVDAGHEVHVHDTDDVATRRALALRSPGAGGSVSAHANAREVLGEAEVVVLATPAGSHGVMAAEAIARGLSVVSISDALEDVRELFDLDRAAQDAEVALVVGAGFAPGLTCLLARHAGDALDEVAEIAVAKAGTGGPACARQHHRAMKQIAWDWLDDAWFERRGGSGRDLVWFPPPIGARDSYKAALPSPLLLQRSFPGATRIVARVTATRRDRFTSRLPMLRPPHADGGPGAVRVEIRGRRDGRFETLVYAVAASPSHGAGVVAAVVAGALDEPSRCGAFGLSELGDSLPLLRRCHESGLSVMTFDGTADL